MEIYYSNGIDSNDGFIYVASRSRLYYELGLLSCESLKSYFPKAHVTLFTHKNFIDERCKLFDKVITGIPIHSRAKMWCMARTPYKGKTVYNDCDSLIMHRDVSKIYDELNDCDIFTGSNLPEAAGDIKWAFIDKERTIIPKHHGSLIGYNNTQLNLDFMQTWFDEYVKQITTSWPYEKHHYKDWQQFDMFTLWRLVSKRFQEFERFFPLNVKILERRWNITINERKQKLSAPPVIVQISRHSWAKMEVYSAIMKGVSDENYTVTKRSLRDPVIEYN